MKLKTKSVLFAACILLSVAIQESGYAQGPITFGFSGFIEYQQSGNVPGLSIGNAFQGSYTFNPLTVGAPHTPPDNSLDTDYNAMLSWSVTIPASGLTFSGTDGVIYLGNNTPYFASDRYIVTMIPDVNQPIMVGGHRFAHFQIDLFAYGFGSGAALLDNSALPVAPPHMELAPHDGNFNQMRGRFVFNDASFQNRITSLTVVPEPSSLTLVGLSLVSLAFQRPKRNRAASNPPRHEPHP